MAAVVAPVLAYGRDALELFDVWCAERAGGSSGQEVLVYRRLQTFVADA